MSERAREPYIPSIKGGEPASERVGYKSAENNRKILSAEFEELRKPFEKRTKHKFPDLADPTKEPGTLMGIAVSGGGIRSATFGLGVLQALANKGRLSKFDYLSTVSGGGYLGASLTWWISRKGEGVPAGGFGLETGNFPYGTDDPSRPILVQDKPEQRRVLQFLRQHGNYLMPGKCLDLAAGAATALRAIFLSLLGWFLLASSAFAAVILLSGSLYRGLTQDGSPIGALLAMDQLLAEVLPEELTTWFSDNFGGIREQAFLLELMWIVAGLILAVAILGAVFYGVTTWLACLRIPFGFFRGSTRRYWARRVYECFSGKALQLFLYLLLLGSIPFVSHLLGEWVREVGLASAMAGIASGLWTFAKSQQQKKGGVPLSVLAPVGAILLTYGVLLGAWTLASWCLSKEFAGWLLVIGLIVNLLVNLNYVSLHRFYRDRLMEAFLPQPNKIHCEAPASYEADRTFLTDVWDFDSPRGPFPLINTNVVLVNDSDRKTSLRGGDNFLLSPLYCGSDATGWCSADKFAGGEMSLASAMAISGAAANPNTGSGGTGVTRDRAVSLLMSILGISLGYWVHHPAWGKLANFCPNRILPGIPDVFGWLHRSDSWFLQLSDGGHFENLALYELIRRRARLIVLCDGSADPDYEFEGLQIAIRLIESDFGAYLKFETDDNKLQTLIPSQEAGYPKGDKVAKRGWIVGEIHYPGGHQGVLIYVTTTLVENMSLKTKGYAARNKTFPDQSTADQFFDEDQFEAYRELGYRIGRDMEREVKVPVKGKTSQGLQEVIDDIEHGQLA